MANTNSATTLGQLTKLAERTQAELAKRDERIDRIVNTGGEANVLEGVQINGTNIAIDGNKIANILISGGKTDGTIAVNHDDIPVTGLADLIAAVNTLKGTSDDSVSGIVNAAINKFATEVSDDKTVNKFAEIVAWIANHPDAAQMVKDIDALEKLVGTIPESMTSTNIVDYVVEAMLNALWNYYTKGDMDTKLSGYVKKDGSKVLSTNDYTTADKAKLSGIATDATKVENVGGGKIKINDTEYTVYSLPSTVLHGVWAQDSEVVEMLEDAFKTAT